MNYLINQSTNRALISETGTTEDHGAAAGPTICQGSALPGLYGTGRPTSLIHASIHANTLLQLLPIRDSAVPLALTHVFVIHRSVRAHV